MNHLQADRIAAILSSRFGLSLSAGVGSDAVGSYFELFPADVDRSESFKLVVHIGWRHLEASFVPGSFAAVLIQAMGRADKERQSIVKTFANSLISDGGRIVMTVNGSEVSPLETATWPDGWNRLSISVKKSPTETSSEDIDSAVSWTGRFLGMILALAPTEEVVVSSSGPSGAPEGTSFSVETTRYERSRLNRAACLQLRGTKCLVCGFDFGEIYGALGEGFIHVHHVVPVSDIGPDYVVNPASDLAPICPNCHNMVHRTEPPLTVEQLQNVIRDVVQSREKCSEMGRSTDAECGSMRGSAK